MAMNIRPYHSDQVEVSAPSASRAMKKIAAPINGPQKLTKPPPIRVIITTKPDELRLMTSGNAPSCASANNAPASPESPADRTKTSHLYSQTWYPTKATRVSFWRIAWMMRPKGECTTRHSSAVTARQTTRTK